MNLQVSLRLAVLALLTAAANAQTVTGTMEGQWKRPMRLERKAGPYVQDLQHCHRRS